VPGLVILAAAAGFACFNPTHHDGDAIRCAGDARSMRLYGIDAPEMPGSCRPGRACTPGDPYASRDHLAGLTTGKTVRCDQMDTDAYGRRVVRCRADAADISCAMVADGYAVERYSRLDCGGAPRNPQGNPQRNHIAVGNQLEPSLWWQGFTIWLLVINLATYTAFAIDKRRAVAVMDRRINRIPEKTLLAMAALGGSAGAIAAQMRLRHKNRKQPFATWLLIIVGLQIGIAAGIAVLNW
jgi:uncharacterized membrane protein YsdA (DUF1294 family)